MVCLLAEPNHIFFHFNLRSELAKVCHTGWWYCMSFIWATHGEWAWSLSYMAGTKPPAVHTRNVFIANLKDSCSVGLNVTRITDENWRRLACVMQMKLSTVVHWLPHLYVCVNTQWCKVNLKAFLTLMRMLLFWDLLFNNGSNAKDQSRVC